MMISIIIVSWNVIDDVQTCLESIKKYPPSANYEQILVDNNSNDMTAEMTRKNFPGVRIIENTENIGFAAANNQGIKISTGRYILLLNPDTIVHPGALDRLIDFLENNPDVGACGPKLLNIDGTTQASARRFPTYKGVLYGHTVCRQLGLFRPQYRQWIMKDFKYDKQSDVDQLMGAALLVRRSAIQKVGLLDTRFFMYFEEVDWCYRMKQADWRVVFQPDSVITHLGGQSSKQVPQKRIILFKSMLKYFRKHRGKFVTAAFSIVFKMALILRNLCHLLISVFTYLAAAGLANKARMKKASDRISLHTLFLTKHLWQIINM